MTGSRFVWLVNIRKRTTRRWRTFPQGYPGVRIVLDRALGAQGSSTRGVPRFSLL